MHWVRHKWEFQSTLPVWGATITGGNRITITDAISIHAPRVGSDEHAKLSVGIVNRISIHAPRVGSDDVATDATRDAASISIHAPRVGSDLSLSRDSSSSVLFQSTLPVWGATRFPNHVLRFARYFNPRSPCGERLYTSQRPSIILKISIHAPRVGSDTVSGDMETATWDFNPRSPCGERRAQLQAAYDSGRFQSTLPVWGATLSISSGEFYDMISIHAPRVGSDDTKNKRPKGRKDFNPRSPCGERRKYMSCHGYT